MDSNKKKKGGCMNNWLINFWAAVTAVLITMLLQGCAANSMEQISAFGKSASIFADNSKRTLDLVNFNSIDCETYNVAINTSLVPGNSILEGLPDKSFQNKYQNTATILEKIGDYARALNGLTVAKYRKDIDAASVDLYAALSGLCMAYKRTTGKDLFFGEYQFKNVHASISEIGTVIIESRRRNAIKMVITQADNAIQVSGRLLEVEFHQNSELSKKAKQNLFDMSNCLRAIYDKQRGQENSTVEFRYIMLMKINQINIFIQTTPELFNSISTGIKKMLEMHAALKLFLLEDKFSTPKIAQQIGELASYSKRIQFLYEKLKPK